MPMFKSESSTQWNTIPPRATEGNNTIPQRATEGNENGEERKVFCATYEQKL